MKYAQKASSRFSLKISQSQPLKIFCMYGPGTTRPPTDSTQTETQNVVQGSPTGSAVQK